MFEDSLMESQNRLSSPNQRWITIVSLTLQCSLAATALVLPLLHPEVLPFHIAAPAINLPLKRAPPPVPTVDSSSKTASTSSTLSSPMATGHPAIDLTHLRSIDSLGQEAAPVTSELGSMTGSDTIPGSIGNSTTGTGTRVTLAPAPATGAIHISRGVSAGLLLAPIRPIYPPIAISTRTEGVVIIDAIISKSGRIESAHATSGPELLRNAALEAIRNARYSPYLLNGLPTEVETTITVNFKLAS
jgi:protein TonB